MPIEFGLEEASNIFLINVSKKLSIAELRQAQGNCESAIKAVGNIKILVVLSDFQGWEKAQGWEDISFAEKMMLTLIKSRSLVIKNDGRI